LALLPRRAPILLGFALRPLTGVPWWQLVRSGPSAGWRSPRLRPSSWWGCGRPWAPAPPLLWS